MSNNVLTSNFSDLSDKITARPPRLARSKCIIYLFAGFIWPDLSIWSFAIVPANFNSENKRTKSWSVWVWDWLRVLTKSFPPPLMNYKTSVLLLDIVQLGIQCFHKGKVTYLLYSLRSFLFSCHYQHFCLVATMLLEFIHNSTSTVQELDYGCVSPTPT